MCANVSPDFFLSLLISVGGVLLFDPREFFLSAIANRVANQISHDSSGTGAEIRVML